MKLTRKEVEHIALLARLELTEEEKSRYRQQLSTILEYVAQLQKLDTSGINTSSNVQPAQACLRKDVAHKGLDRQEALKNAPSAESGQYRVPPVME